MKYLSLPAQDTPIRVSKLAIGTAVKMRGLSREELFDRFDEYLGGGGNCIDTARAYSGGEAEKLVGEYLSRRKNRNRLVISTKGGHPASDGTPRLTANDLKEDLDNSLRALGTEMVDIYWLHKDDPSVPVESIMDGLNQLVRTGKVRTIGCSNWHVDRIAQANAYASASGQQGFAASQIQWSLAEAEETKFAQFTAVLMDNSSYEWYLEREIPVFAFSPQAQGFFSKAAKVGVENLEPQLRYFYESKENRRRLNRVMQIAKEKNVPVSVPVLSYLLNNQLPCVAVFGAPSREMLAETMAAADFEMDARVILGE